MEDIQEPSMPEREFWDNIVVIPGNYIETIKITSKKRFVMLPLFEAPCRFGGTCTVEKLNDYCIRDKRVKNNWICWRDGILRDEDGKR